MRRNAFRTPAALFLAALLRAAGASAQPMDVEAEHARGVALRAQGRDADAVGVFRAIFERTGEPRALARLGLAEGALQRWAEADEHLATALARAADPWIVANRASLEQALRAVRSHLGFVTVTCATPNATVQVPGAPPEPLPLRAPLRVATGFVDLTVRAPGHLPTSRHVAVPAGAEPIAVEVTLTPEAAAPTTPAPAAPAPPPPAPVEIQAPAPQGVPIQQREPARATWQRPLGIGLLAGAGVALGVGVAGAVMREAAAARFNDGRCLLHPDRDEVTSGGAPCVDALGDADTGAAMAVAGFVAAGVLGAAGITLTLLAPRSSDAPRVQVAAGGGLRATLTLPF